MTTEKKDNVVPVLTGIMIFLGMATTVFGLFSAYGPAFTEGDIRKINARDAVRPTAPRPDTVAYPTVVRDRIQRMMPMQRVK